MNCVVYGARILECLHVEFAFGDEIDGELETIRVNFRAHGGEGVVCSASRNR